MLGVHILHAKATELIAQSVLGKNLEMTVEDLAHSIHPHPTVSELIMEAAHATLGHGSCSCNTWACYPYVIPFRGAHAAHRKKKSKPFEVMDKSNIAPSNADDR